ncbi:MAG: hypothetical protein IKL41_01680, partial [Clostridia bacterium]|nr:hypothetical protein [Clostridia bacterium]
MTGFLTQFVSFALSIITSVAMLFAPVTEAMNLTNYMFAEAFEQIEYDEDRLVPTEDADGWVFNTDRPLKIVQLTDIHIAGGALSKGFDRAAFLREAAQIEGHYVPSLYDVTYNEDGTIKAVTPKDGAPAKVRK